MSVKKKLSKKRRYLMLAAIGVFVLIGFVTASLAIKQGISVGAEAGKNKLSQCIDDCIKDYPWRSGGEYNQCKRDCNDQFGGGGGGNNGGNGPAGGCNMIEPGGGQCGNNGNIEGCSAGPGTNWHKTYCYENHKHIINCDTKQSCETYNP